MEQCTHEEEQFKKSMVEGIQHHGWYVIQVMASDYLPGFAYTIGLWKTFGHPELIAFGLKLPTLHAILNTAGDLVKGGQTLATGTNYYDFLENSPTQFISVDPGSINDYFGYAIWYNKTREFPALQMVWTDRNQQFPWEAGFEEEFIIRQPLLDRNADFKFREAKNLGVFTTRQWLEQRKPILRVVHDHDGDWQFLTGDQEQTDARIVCLSELIKADPSLNEVFNLNYGEAAERDKVGGEWSRSTTDEEEDEEEA